jgi:uncharacterized Zn finger protein
MKGGEYIMATSKCPSCGNTSFEAKELTPKNSNYRLMSVQCYSCGSVVSVMDLTNIGTETQQLKKKVNELEKQLMYSNDLLQRIAHKLNSL